MNGLYQQQLIHQGPIFKKKYLKRGLSFDINLLPEQEEGILLFISFLNTKKLQIEQYGQLKKDQRSIFDNFFDSLKDFPGNNINIKKEEFFMKDFSAFIKEISDKKYKKISQYIDVPEDFKICTLDGKKMKIINQNIPFGIFSGRGTNGKIGILRKNIEPKDVIVNSTQNIPVPEYFKGQKWKQQLSDPKSQFLAAWKDEVTNKVQYMRVEHIEQNNRQKFDFARQVARDIDQILKKVNSLKQRRGNLQDLIKKMENIDDKYIHDLKMYICIFLIYSYGLRVGSHDLDNDVQGVTQLKENNMIISQEQKNGKVIYMLRLNFISKDSMSYDQTHQIDKETYEIIDCILQYNKQKNLIDIFDFTSNDLNEFLDSIYPGLSAKVFRTYRASFLMHEEIMDIKDRIPKESDKSVILNELRISQLKIAKFCNHVKSKKKEKNTKDSKKDKYVQQLKKYKKKLKEYEKDMHDYEKKLQNDLNQQEKEIINKKIQELKQKIIKLQNKIQQIESKLKYYDQDQELSISTSRQNYIDPRILVSFCMHYNINIEKVYTKKEIQMISWCIPETNDDFRYV